MPLTGFRADLHCTSRYSTSARRGSGTAITPDDRTNVRGRLNDLGWRRFAIRFEYAAGRPVGGGNRKSGEGPQEVCQVFEARARCFGRVVDDGQKSLRMHSSHRGRRAMHTRRPCRIRRSDNPVHSSGGTIEMTCRSILTGSRVDTSLRRLVRRITCVSTANPGTLNPAPRITLAVLRPIPGTWSKPSMLASTSAGSAAPRSKAVGYRAKSFGVTRFTILSVVCADRIVAVSSWNGFSCASSVTAGYSSRRRSTVNTARVRAPRGRRGSGGAFFFFALGGKELARRGCDLGPFGASSKSRGRGFHDSAECIRTFRLQLVDHSPDLRFNLLSRHPRRQIRAQEGHLGLLTPGGLFAPALAICVDRVLAALDLLADEALDETIVDGPARACLLSRPHDLAFEKRKCVQRMFVAAPPCLDELGLKPVIKSHGGDCHTCTDRRPITDNRPLCWVWSR